MKPNFIRAYDLRFDVPGHGTVRTILQLSAALPETLKPDEEEMKLAIIQASAIIERTLSQQLEAPPPAPACKDCRFFAAGFNQCRQQPPVVPVEYVDLSNNERWPRVDALEWCGEFKPRTP